MSSRYENAYRFLLRDALVAEEYPSRTGKTRRLHNITIKANLLEGFPILTGRQMFWKNIIGEAEWMLSGSTNAFDLHKYKIHIWDAWANEKGELGPTYGAQLRRQWETTAKGIIKDPFSRRHIINLWDVDKIDQMALPPCYYALQFYTTTGNQLNLTVTSRSSDLAVGLPYDISVLAYLLHCMSTVTSMQLGDLCFNACDAHINIENEVAIQEYLKCPTYPLPKLVLNGLENYLHGAHIKMTVKI